MAHDNEDARQTFIVAVGNIADGMSFVGPFEDHDEAMEYAETKVDDDDDWRVIALTAPEGRD